MDLVWISLLSRARSGSHSLLQSSIGEEGSAGWQQGEAMPKTIVLCDLSEPPAELPPFPVEFAEVEELDLSGNGLESLPPLAVLQKLKRLYLGGSLANNS
ncbi:unnamed protein product, partial [Heterosigma akashiwo]